MLTFNQSKNEIHLKSIGIIQQSVNLTRHKLRHKSVIGKFYKNNRISAATFKPTPHFCNMNNVTTDFGDITTVLLTM
jgi:hypothetical protein